MSVSIKKNLSNIHTFNFPKKTCLSDVNSLAILKNERIAFISTPETIYYVTIKTEERVNVDELEVLEGVHKDLRIYSSVDAIGTGKNKEMVLVVSTKVKNPSYEIRGSQKSNPSQIFFCPLQFDEKGKLILLDKKRFETPSTSLFVRKVEMNGKIYFLVFSVDSKEISFYGVKGSGINMTFSEMTKTLSTVFPELRRRDKINGKTIRFQQYFRDKHRFHCQGTLEGQVRLTVFDISTNRTKLTDERNFDSPIGDLSFFQISRGNVGMVHPLVANINQMIMLNEEEEEFEKSDYPYLRTVNLVIGESIGRVFVFWDVLKTGLKKYTMIHDSNDSVLCVYPFDVSGNGLRELLVGTYSQKMIILKFDEHQTFEFKVVDTYHFSSPVLSLGSLDFTDDSTEELVICLKNSFNIFQQKMERLQEMLHRKFEKFEKLEEYYLKNCRE